MLFSQRKGVVPIQKSIQLEAMDDDLRNSLWSALYIAAYNRWEPYAYGWTPESSEINNLFTNYWVGYFKKPVDDLPGMHDEKVYSVKNYFFTCHWTNAYDFIEFTAKSLEILREQFKSLSNSFLERENSAYRFVENEITPISDEIEINAIEEGIGGGEKAVRNHLTAALQMLSDRKNPDYRNSVKESISSVEATCRIISEKPKAVLSDALKAIIKATPIHPAFESALHKLYGFSSDEKGVRHSLVEESSISYADAKFMLVAAAAFCNFLTAKKAENSNQRQ